MARTTNLSHRIERLLNDTIFHQSFAASRRALVVGLVFPLALIAATSLVRVEAAGQAPPTPPAPAPAPVSPQPAPPPEAPLAGQSNPDQDPIVAPAPAPAAMPAPPAAPDIAPPVPPIPSPYGEIRDRANEQETTTSTQSDTVTNTNTNTNTKDKDGHHHSTSAGQGYSDSYSSNCDSWAVVTGPKEHISFSGEWNSGTQEAIEKARKLANGKFIWFTHNGNSYMIDDPALIAQVEVMYEPMKALDRAQEELGRQQAKLGQEQEQLAKEQSLAGVPTPDMSREIAQVDAAMAKLKAEKNAKLSQEELADIEAKLGELQGRLGEIDGRIGEQQGLVGEKQGHLGELQGKLGEEQGRLGEKQGKLAQEADRKVKSIIDQSLGNGKARPVE